MLIADQVSCTLEVKMEEGKMISIENLLINIKKRLDVLCPVMDFYASQTGLYDYSAPVAEVGRIVEEMCLLLLHEYGYEFEESRGLLIDKTSGRQFGAAVSLMCNAKIESVPEEINNYLDKIRRSRNKAVHLPNVSYEEAIIFAEAFDCFTAWFVVSSSTLRKASSSFKNDFCSHVDSLRRRMIFKVKIGDAEPKEYAMTTIIPQAVQSIQTENNIDGTETEILNRLSELLGIAKKVDAGMVKIDGKLNELADKLDHITKRIGDYQSLVTRQIDMASSNEEIERIISAYTDECVNRIVNGVNGRSAEQMYSDEKEKLLFSLGESIWNKLDPISQNFLITAKVTYNNLVKMSDIIDYSGVCLLVTKAVEVEMKNRFYIKYREFLKERYPGKNGYKQYPTPLLNKYGKLIQAKHFTLGTVAYVLCYSVDDRLPKGKIENNHAKLMEFMSSCLMKGKSQQIVEDHIQFIAEGVENIRKDYRNPSAHTNRLQSTNAQQCFDLVLDVEKLLREMLDLLDI